MKLTIQSTSKVVQLNGVPARIWEGQTESGIPVHCFVTRVAVREELNREQFEKELTSHEPPSAEVEFYPLRMVL